MSTQNEAGGQISLTELIFREYEKDRKQEQFSYKVLAFIRRIFSKGEEIPLTMAVISKTDSLSGSLKV